MSNSNMNTDNNNHPLFAATMESDGTPTAMPPSQPNPWNVPCQATLSFAGRVFVFDNVPCDKVNFALLVLGGYEFDHSSTNRPLPPIRNDDPKRRQCLHRYYEKKKRRCFEKRIRYNVRRDVALKIHRDRGQFVGKKVQEGSIKVAIEMKSSCDNCGVESSDTPLMRKGPNGPKTLCNACGLYWTIRGRMRNICKF
ncbi:GATA transcription factor 25-like [Salvia divinorum]|uniref:GATA transcription factor 25-like n=1 Tax=Salvia divinorum TaxID=28513 RepID=A0ABD1HDF8_SALDI